MRGSLPSEVSMAARVQHKDLYAWLQGCNPWTCVHSYTGATNGLVCIATRVQPMDLYAWIQGCNQWTCVHGYKWSNQWTCMHSHNHGTFVLGYLDVTNMSCMATKVQQKKSCMHGYNNGQHGL